MIRKQSLLGLLTAGTILFSVACQNSATQEQTDAQPEKAVVETVGEDLMPAWAVNANIYEQ